MKKAFAYLRVSGKGQLDGDGFPRQREAIRRCAAARSLQIVRAFEEEGVSGTVEGIDRPAFHAMIEAILANGVRTIVIERLDRLARDLMVQEHVIADLQRRGVELVSVAEPDLCSNEPTRKAFRQMQGIFAEYDKSMTVAKLKAARQRVKSRTGRCEGRKPYGSRPGEGEVIDRIRALVADGKSFAAIAGELNDAGIRPREAERWHPYVILRVARREKKPNHSLVWSHAQS